MSTAICTLYEGDYHHGVATLFNSLLRNGFRGRLFVGYRGARPAWSSRGRAATVGAWSDAWIVEAGGDCEIVLVPVASAAHFANIKPDFMLSLLEQPTLGIDYLFYLDPDICVAREWQFFADWAACGVALCEDVNSPIAENHPKRVGWQRCFGEYGVTLRHRFSEYVNSGCVGVDRRDMALLRNWQVLSGYMAEVIGGLGVTKVGKGAPFSRKGFASCFDCSDQDTLNAAIHMTDGPIFSVLPRCAMGFERGELVLPHALGPDKPWRRRYLANALRAVAPSLADKAFWQFADAPIAHVSRPRLLSSRAALAAASAIARLYTRR